MNLHAPLLASALVLLTAADRPVDPALEASPLEVVRIKRDFGKPHFDLAIDAALDPNGARLGEVRLHWVNTDEADRRKPLGPIAARLVKLRVHRHHDRALTVTVTGDGKEFRFELELTLEGVIHAYAAAIGPEGQVIPRCRADTARLITHRVLGITTGLAHIDIDCIDPNGHRTPAQIHHHQL